MSGAVDEMKSTEARVFTPLVANQ